MLLGEDFSGCHDAHLIAIVHRHQRRQQGYHGLAAADISLEQPVHVLAVARVFPDLPDDPLLGSREFEGNALGIEPVEHPTHHRECRPWLLHRLAVAVLHEQQLQKEKLLEFQTEPSQPFGVRIGRLVHLLERYGQPRHAT